MPLEGKHFRELLWPHLPRKTKVKTVPTVKAAIDEYLLACQADGLSAATLKWYRSILGMFENSFEDRALGEITPSDLRQYIVQLRSREDRYINAPQKPTQNGGLSEQSIAGYVTALHAFWGWVCTEYGIENPMRNIRRIKRQQPGPKAIDPGDFVLLFNSVRNTRDRAILCFLADTGCRLGGLISLKLDDLDLIEQRATVTEKGGKRRTVVFTHYTREVLSAWLAERESSAPEVFVSFKTRRGLTGWGVSQLMKRLKKRAGVKGRVNPHSFRHQFARAYIENGGDIVTLAKLLGHSNINITTAYYAVWTEDELARLHEKYSPLRSFIIDDA